MATKDAQLRAILAMFDSFARLDADEFASHLTEDVVFRPSGFVTGRSEFLGREAPVVDPGVMPFVAERRRPAPQPCTPAAVGTRRQPDEGQSRPSGDCGR